MPKAESLSQSLVLSQASTNDLLSRSVSSLTGLEGELKSSSMGWSELWLATGTVLLPWFWTKLLCWIWVGQVEDCAHCLHAQERPVVERWGGLSGPGVALSGGTSTHGPMVAASSSPPEHVGPHKDCPKEHVGTAQGLSAVERGHVRSLTKLAGLTWERTSLNVVSNCSCALACRSSCFSANFSLCSAVSAHILPISLAISSCCLWSSSCSSWDFA